MQERSVITPKKALVSRNTVEEGFKFQIMLSNRKPYSPVRMKDSK